MLRSILKRSKITVQSGFLTFVWNESQDRARAPWRIIAPLIPVLGIAGVVGWFLFGRVPGPILIVISQLTLALSAIVLFALSTRYLDRGRSIWDYGLRVDRRWALDVAVGFLIGVTAVGVPYSLGIAVGWFDRSAFLSPSPIGLWVGLLLVIIAFLCTGFWEELVFRGVLMANAADGLRSWLSRRTLVIAVLVLQAVVFGVLHIGQWTTQAPHPAFVTTWILAGFMFGMLYLLSNDLALPIGVHAAMNTAQDSLVTETPPSQDGWSAIVLVEPVSESMLFGHGGIMMLSTIVLAGVLGVVWLWYSSDSNLDLWSHPAITPPTIAEEA